MNGARRTLTCRLLIALGALFVWAALPGWAVAASMGETLRSATAPLAMISRTGIVYDRVLPLAHLERFDGSEPSPPVDPATWKQAWDELRRASAAPERVPTLDAIAAGARAEIQRGVIPLAVFDRAFERIRPGALQDGSLTVEPDRIVGVNSGALMEQRAFAASALVARTYHGGDVAFSLDPSRMFCDGGQPRSLEIDLADGRGLMALAPGKPVRARYAETGPHTLRLRLTRADGSVAVSRFVLDVAALATPNPDDTLHIVASTQYQSVSGTGDAYVYRAQGHTQIVNPVVVIEGFDTDNSMNWDELYALLNKQNLIETLRADGFDAVVLNFTDATAAIQQNAFVVSQLLLQVQSEIAPQTTIALVGASMGGLCSRYALAWMEAHAVPHRVRVWLSFDSPQAGADIPLGLQYWINFFSGQSASAAAFLTTLQRPAAKQMLLYHFTTPAGTTGQPDPMRATMLADFASAGNYPALTRRVAIANGSGTGANQGFLPLDQVIRYEYSSILAAITGNVWALPDQASGRIFNGSMRILFSTTTQSVTVSGTQPWDGAPGGYRNSFTELDTTAAPYGDIIALHPAHCFIPTVSALAVQGAGPFYSLQGDPNLLSHTPFDAVYTPAANQEHVLITPENAVWVRNEIESGLLAVPASRPGAGSGVSLSALSPNPFTSAARITFALPREGVADLRVYDAAGREVRALVHESRAAGTYTISWDGNDERGQRVRAGVYFVRLVAGAAGAFCRLAKLD